MSDPTLHYIEHLGKMDIGFLERLCEFLSIGGAIFLPTT